MNFTKKIASFSFKKHSLRMALLTSVVAIFFCPPLSGTVTAAMEDMPGVADPAAPAAPTPTIGGIGPNFNTTNPLVWEPDVGTAWDPTQPTDGGGDQGGGGGTQVPEMSDFMVPMFMLAGAWVARNSRKRALKQAA